MLERDGLIEVRDLGSPAGWSQVFLISAEDLVDEPSDGMHWEASVCCACSDDVHGCLVPFSG